MVINLAAGLDARPYRMDLPSSLQWVEVDLPEILAYKEQILANEKPKCALERVRLDLSDRDARGAVFQQLGSRSKSALILSEGLLVYLTPENVASLVVGSCCSTEFSKLDPRSGFARFSEDAREAKDRGRNSAKRAFPLSSLRRKALSISKSTAGSPSTCDRCSRLPRHTSVCHHHEILFAFFPDTKESRIKRPWTGICLFEKQSV